MEEYYETDRRDSYGCAERCAVVEDLKRARLSREDIYDIIFDHMDKESRVWCGDLATVIHKAYNEMS